MFQDYIGTGFFLFHGYLPQTCRRTCKKNFYRKPYLKNWLDPRGRSSRKKVANMKEEVDGNKKLIADLNKVAQNQEQNSKLQTEEKKFIKTNDLYKKNLELFAKKKSIF